MEETDRFCMVTAGEVKLYQIIGISWSPVSEKSILVQAFTEGLS